MTIDVRTYEIKPRPANLGGGWKVTLFEDGEEAGGGVFPADEYQDAFDLGEDWVSVNDH